jgi:tetratricopeptide (TPR) repeat protein
VDQERIDEAREAVARARAINPDNVDLLQWMGKFQLTFEGDLDAAEASLERARLFAPENPDVRVLLARVLLTRERFAEGWEHYEWRKRQPGRAVTYTKFPYPEWDGQLLEGKAVAVNGEQGLGDEIMFASCLPEIASRARRCVLYCNRRLEALFRRSFDCAEVHAGSHMGQSDPFPILEGIDFQVAAASLPRVLRRSIADFPEHAGYLKADPANVQEWRRRLDALGAGLKIGLSWKGGTPLSDQTRRTLRLEQLAPLLALPGAHWVSLQYGECKDELEAFAGRTETAIHHWREGIDDLDQMAALVCALDLRISVCNTLVHLSGGLGKEVWVLAPLTPDWRYGHKGLRMLWYPAARMFRQPVAGDWATPLEAAERELAARLARP